ncbi:hypothetical protein BJY01DRAFT_247445 [Aspergillus pseudoustus]|uniref:Lanthionine synthetase C family protein n=1 Tax=Aspergillus pseudoustus TaxID=1810923 RepID=A0ABR4K0R5_9EURO
MPRLPQFYANSLRVPEITKPALQELLSDLQAAVINGVRILESNHPAGRDDGPGIFTGDAGIAVAYLRLAHQRVSLDSFVNGDSLPSFYELARARIPEDFATRILVAGRLSPLSSTSPLSAVTVHILYHLSTGSAPNIRDGDLVLLRDGIEMALSHGAMGIYHGHELGADEVLFGRAGLLWTIINLQKWESSFDERQRNLLGGALEDEMVEKLVEAMVRAGREGGEDYRSIIEDHGEKNEWEGDAKPLMWVWMKGHYGLGWAHGLTGILSVLLSVPTSILSPHLPSIGATISFLCEICINEDGHLPTCIPPRHTSSSRTSPLVQICHGAPAFLALMACALQVPELVRDYWTPEWDTALRLATEQVWEEGLLSKGGGLCHGIAGNAWPFLMIYVAFEENAAVLNTARGNDSHHMPLRDESEGSVGDPLTPDFFLARALAMLLHARETQPYNQIPETAPDDYRMPDHPYSLFEGLAGTVCAWSEACVVLRGRLREMELREEGDDVSVREDSVVKECKKQQLGFPFLGGNGVTGVL